VSSGINIRRVLKVIGFALIAEGFFMATALPFSFYYRAGDESFISISVFICLVAGLLLLLPNLKTAHKGMGRREGFLIVTLSWVIMSFFGALPFYISERIPSFTNAFFETMSGFSTTGASILTDIEIMPEGLLFWRSLTHWIGGLGIIVFSVALLSFVGAGGSQLVAAEMSGPVKDKIHPRISETARRLWGVYIVLTIMQTSFLMAGGMCLHDALCHTFGTLGTGGFSTKNSSIGHFSPYIQYVITFFMIAGATNFALFYFAFTGKPGRFLRNTEFKTYIGIIVLSGMFMGLYLFFSGYYPLEKSFRTGFFHTVSILTTTGFSTDDFLLWPVPLWTLLFLFMFIGGSAGSTTAGMKVVRFILVFKSGLREFKRIIHPNAVIPVRIDKVKVPDSILSRVFIFVFLYLATFVVMTFAISFTGKDLLTSAGAVAASLGCIGPGLGEVGPASNYAGFSDVAKWMLSLCMLLGRLELFSVFILFTPSFWKK
jgi:trk system potassium uptake protein